jgi:hypothetical protein
VKKLRTLTGVMLGTATLIGAVPASADPSAEQSRFSGLTAMAAWFDEATGAELFVSVSDGRSTDAMPPQRLFVAQSIPQYDTIGTLVGYLEIVQFLDTSRGYTFSIDRTLNRAILVASDLPVTQCRYDTGRNLLGCTEITIDLDVTWTARAPVVRNRDVARVVERIYVVVAVSHTDTRDAVSSGIVAGIPVTSDDLLLAELSRVRFGFIRVCIADCPLS